METSAMEIAIKLVEGAVVLFAGLVAMISAFKAISQAKDCYYSSFKSFCGTWLVAAGAAAAALACGVLLFESTEYLVLVPAVAIVLLMLGAFVWWARTFMDF